MVPTALQPHAVLAVGAVRATLQAWRFRGRLHVTVIAKASFAFAADEALRPTEPQPLFRGEVTHDHSPVRSARFTTDLVPYLGLADVLFTGHAHAPPGTTVEAMTVRLGLFSEARALLDKSLRVRKAGGFRELPLRYERAFGGPGWADNPYGSGATASVDPPNVFDPNDERRLAGFAPIGQVWTARRRMLPSRSPIALDAPVVEIPDDLDWSYFQGAPADQRVPHLRGDEWIVMDGLHPTLPRLRMRLPGARGLARIHGLSAFGIAEGQPLPLRCDMLRIDGDEQRCTLSFRAEIPLPSPEALPALRVAAGVELPGQPIAWPDPAGAWVPAIEEARAPAPPSPRGEGTMALTDEDLEPVVAEMPAATLVIQTGPGAPLAPPLLAGAPLPFHGAPDATYERTIETRWDAPPGPALPFAGAGAAEARSPPPPFLTEARVAPSRPADFGATLMQTADEEAIVAHRHVLPFAVADAPPPDASPAPAPLPEVAGASPPPPPSPPPIPDAPEPPAAAPPPAVVTTPVTTASASPWAPAPEAPAPPRRAPRPPPPGQPLPPPTLNEGLYGRFGGSR